MLVAETVGIFAIEARLEAMVASGDAPVVGLVAAGGVLNLVARFRLSRCLWQRSG